MITVAEQHFLERVPNLLKDVSDSLQTIAGNMTLGSVYVFTAEQAWKMDTFDTVVRVFATEEAARRFLRLFVYEDGDEAIADYVRKNGWFVEQDEPDHYFAYRDGCYADDHVECKITKVSIEK